MMLLKVYRHNATGHTMMLHSYNPNQSPYQVSIFYSLWFPRYCLEKTRGMLLLTKVKRPLKFKMLCGFNKHAVKLRMHKAAPYAFPIPLNTF